MAKPADREFLKRLLPKGRFARLRTWHGMALHLGAAPEFELRLLAHAALEMGPGIGAASLQADTRRVGGLQPGSIVVLQDIEAVENRGERRVAVCTEDKAVADNALNYRSTPGGPCSPSL